MKKKNKMHLKKRKRRKFKTINIILVLLISIAISVFSLLKLFSDKAMPQLISYSEVETKKIVSSMISGTIMEEVASNINTDELFIMTKDSEGNIKSIDINSSSVNKLLVKASDLVEKNLKYLESGEVDKLNLTNVNFSSYDEEKLKKGIIYELPSGIIFNNILLNNLLPKIPVKINLIGDILCKLNTDIKSYGINNALLKVNIGVVAEVKILLPFVSKSTEISTDIPIIIKIIEGNVPSYYYGGYLSTPYITTSTNN